MQKFEKWTETYTELLEADKERSLEPEELEILATAAYLTGRDTECIETLERAHQNYLSHGQFEQAVRCTFWLGIIHINRGDKAQGSGWITSGGPDIGQFYRSDEGNAGGVVLTKWYGRKRSAQRLKRLNKHHF